MSATLSGIIAVAYIIVCFIPVVRRILCGILEFLAAHLLPIASDTFGKLVSYVLYVILVFGGALAIFIALGEGK